jgi:hypothetical protein
MNKILFLLIPVLMVSLLGCSSPGDTTLGPSLTDQLQTGGSDVGDDKAFDGEDSFSLGDPWSDDDEDSDTKGKVDDGQGKVNEDPDDDDDPKKDPMDPVTEP